MFVPAPFVHAPACVEAEVDTATASKPAIEGLPAVTLQVKVTVYAVLGKMLAGRPLQEMVPLKAGLSVKWQPPPVLHWASKGAPVRPAGGLLGLKKLSPMTAMQMLDATA